MLRPHPQSHDVCCVCLAASSLETQRFPFTSVTRWIFNAVVFVAGNDDRSSVLASQVCGLLQQPNHPLEDSNTTATQLGIGRFTLLCSSRKMTEHSDSECSVDWLLPECVGRVLHLASSHNLPFDFSANCNFVSYIRLSIGSIKAAFFSFSIGVSALGFRPKNRAL